MNELACTVLVLLGLGAGRPSELRQSAERATTDALALQAPREDAWLGQDKFRHFWMSYAVTAAGFAAARSVGIKSETALTLGMATAAAAGVGKELYDRKHGYFISVRDLVADALGIGAAFFLLRELH